MLDSYRSSFAHLNVAAYLFSGKYFDLENLLKFFFYNTPPFKRLLFNYLCF